MAYGKGALPPPPPLNAEYSNQPLPPPPPLTQSTRRLDGYSDFGASDRTLLNGESFRERSESPLRSMRTTTDDDVGGSKRRRAPKVPWDPYLYKMADLKGNSEQCGCGSIFVEEDTFCYRCGNRRPIEVSSLPLHVSRMPEPPIDEVGERMNAWNEAYTQRRIALQALKRDNEKVAEKLEHRGTPHVSPRSQDLAAGLRPIVERSKGILWMKEFELQRERDRVGEEKAKEYTLKPNISRRARSLERGIDELYKHKRKCDARVDQKRREKVQADLSECTFQPEVRQTRRYRVVNTEPVHDRLHKDAAQRSASKQAAKKEAHEDWSLSNTRRARTESPKPPSMQTPRNPMRMPSAPAPYSDFMKAISQDRKSGKTTTTSIVVDDGTPNGRRGPRASAPVLLKEELRSSEKRRRRRKRDGSQSAGSWRSQSGSMSLPSSRGSSQKSSRSRREDPPFEPPKPVWTGGRNVVRVTSKFKTLLEGCQPELPEAQSGRGRKSRFSSFSNRGSQQAASPQPGSTRASNKRNTLRSQAIHSVNNW